MLWVKGYSSLTENSTTPNIDHCIKCVDREQVQARITTEFGEGNYNSGLICRKCYILHQASRVAMF